MTRRGVSLIEILIVVAILGLLIGLILGAIQKVRAAALLTESSNNLRQIILGVHQLADQDQGRIKGLTQAEPPRKPLYTDESMQSIFRAILPWTCPNRPTSWRPDMTSEELTQWGKPIVKTYRSPADPSYVPVPWYTELGDLSLFTDKCSYVANILAFDRVHNFPVSVPDGTSSTIAFAEHYYMSGGNWNSGGNPGWAAMNYDAVLPPIGSSVGGLRRATFADKVWLDVMPVTDPATKRTTASIPGMTFQYRPRFESADYRLPQTPHPGGLPIALFDGSVRTLSPGINESVFWSLVTPNGGEVVGDF
jgi:prepilin-type N-terminal cleavage/methylation domain-containing protein